MPAKGVQIDDLSVSVICEPGPDTELLAREVQRTRARVTRIWPMPPRLPDDHDILVCDYTESLTDALPWSPGEAGSALIVVLPACGIYNYELLTSCSPDAVLHRPFRPHMVKTSLMIARNQFLYFKRLQMRIARLDETLRAARDIERAKHIIMQSRSVSESEAYECLRRSAMDRRVTIATMATAIIDSQVVLR